jgi:hypothetical protein
MPRILETTSSVEHKTAYLAGCKSTNIADVEKKVPMILAKPRSEWALYHGKPP